MSSTMSRMKKDRFPFHYGRGKSGGTKLVQNYGVQSNHGKVKFGSLMGALKLVRTSTKLDDFDALFLHNV